MRRGLWIIATLLLATLTVGSEPCVDQVFQPIPTGMDSTQIVTDPVSGDKLLIGTLQGIVGMPFTLIGRACDPDVDDTVKAWVLPNGPQLVLDPNGIYTLPVSLTREGWHYVSVAATDGMAVRQGTWAIYARRNRPPSLCGGQR